MVKWIDNIVKDDVEPPYTSDQIDSFNGFQESGVFHEFTCGNERCTGKSQYYCPHGKHCNTETCDICGEDYNIQVVCVESALSTGDILVAQTDGLHCPSCNYIQYWCYPFQMDWSWVAIKEETARRFEIDGRDTNDF